MTMKKVYLQADSYREETREPNDEDSWDNGDSVKHWSIKGLSLSEHDSGEYSFIENPIIGETLYAVYSIHSTGDSFGTYDKEYLTLFDVYRNKQIAEQVAKTLRTTTMHSIEIVNDNLEKYTAYVPWLGYFDSLDEVTVAAFVLEK